MSAVSRRMRFRQADVPEYLQCRGDCADGADLWITDIKEIEERYSDRCVYLPSAGRGLTLAFAEEDLPWSSGSCEPDDWDEKEKIIEDREEGTEEGTGEGTAKSGGSWLDAEEPYENRRYSGDADGEDLPSDQPPLITRKLILDALNQLWFWRMGRPAEYLSLSRVSSAAFCGAGGGSGVTACALSCARMLHEVYGRKCLYLNMTPVDDSGNYLKKEGSCSLLPLLYALKRGRHVPILPYLAEDAGVWYFRGTVTGLDEHVGAADLDMLIAELQRQGGFHHILLDFGTGLTEHHIELMQSCGAVLVVGEGPEVHRTTFRRNWEKRMLDLFPQAAMIQNRDDGEGSQFRSVLYGAGEGGEVEEDDHEYNREDNHNRGRESEGRRAHKTENKRGHPYERGERINRFDYRAGDSEDNEDKRYGRSSAGNGRKKGAEQGERPRDADDPHPSFSVSDCPEAFIRMGGRLRIDLSGCIGLDFGQIAAWLEERG